MTLLRPRSTAGALALALLLLIAGAGIGWTVAQAAKEPSAHRDALARTSQVRGAPDRTLALDRVRVDPGAELALHHHQGTQIAFIHKGTLTYTVHRGKAMTYRGQSDQKPKVVARIKAGQTAKIRTGEWIVEQPSNHHSAANRGRKPVVIYLANLLRKGAPPSTPG